MRLPCRNRLRNRRPVRLRAPYYSSSSAMSGAYSKSWALGAAHFGDFLKRDIHGRLNGSSELLRRWTNPGRCQIVTLAFAARHRVTSPSPSWSPTAATRRRAEPSERRQGQPRGQIRIGSHPTGNNMPTPRMDLQPSAPAAVRLFGIDGRATQPVISCWMAFPGRMNSGAVRQFGTILDSPPLTTHAASKRPVLQCNRIRTTLLWHSALSR